MTVEMISPFAARASLTAAALLIAAPSLAQTSSGATGGADGRLAVVSAQALDDDAQSESIEVRIDNGTVTVKRNGEVIPADQVRRTGDGGLIIVDKDGKELSNVRLFTTRMGDRGENLFELVGGAFAGDDLSDEPAPKVMLGLHMGEPGPALEKHLSLEPGACIMITGVLEGLPAFEAGLGEYDVIVDIEGEPAGGNGAVRKALTSKNPGDVITLRVIQAGKQKDIKVRVEAFDAEKMKSAKLLGKDGDGSPWLRFGDLAPGMQDMKLNLDNLHELQGRWLVTPEIGEWHGHLKGLQPHLEALEPRIRELQPMIEKYLRDALQKHGVAEPNADAQVDTQSTDVEKQLDRLDERMAELEKMLQKLVDRQAKP